MSLSKLFLPGIIKLFPQGRVWLGTPRLGTGKTITFFYSVAEIQIRVCLTGIQLTTIYATLHPSELRFAITELRCTITELCCTLSELRCTSINLPIFITDKIYIHVIYQYNYAYCMYLCREDSGGHQQKTTCQPHHSINICRYRT